MCINCILFYKCAENQCFFDNHINVSDIANADIFFKCPYIGIALMYSKSNVCGDTLQMSPPCGMKDNSFPEGENGHQPMAAP